MICPKCQKENPEGLKFCGECGARMERICPKCLFVNPPQFKFCGECGYDLRALKEPTPIDYAQPQSYTPKHLADKILHTRSTLEGERKLVTVLFADVANFTSLSEKLEPEDNEKGFEGSALMGLGRVLAILKDQKLNPFYAQGRMFLGEFYLDGGRKEKALENLKEAEVMFQEMGMDYWLDRTRILLAKVV